MTNKVLLSQLAAEQVIKPTGAKPKLPTSIRNLNENTLEVYSIPLKYLYYNDENGRISTAISREEERISIPAEGDLEPYNLKIEEMVFQSNPQKLKATKKSIGDKKQQVFGYVLGDGRVIDGNRRFTALRQLSREEQKTFEFEAVILPFSYESEADRSEIKRLELALQMGEEAKEVYDPVDLSLDVYKTVKELQLMDAGDYANESGMKKKEIQERINVVELMQDFLETINAKPNSYYLIKDLGLYAALAEVSKKLNQQFEKGEPKFEQTKVVSFAMLSRGIAAGKDGRAAARDYLREIVSSQINSDFNDEVEETVEDLRDRFEEAPVTTASDFREILDRAQPELRKINSEYNETVNRLNRGQNVEFFIASVKESLNTLKDMQKGDGMTGSLTFSDFNKDEIKEIRQYLVDIQYISRELIDTYDSEL